MNKLNLLGMAVLLLLTALPAAADDLFGTLNYRGSVIKPSLLKVDGKTVLSLEDPEVKKLIALSLSQLQWSSTGQTLYVFTPGRESFWSHDSERVTVNSQDMTAPGRMFAGSPPTMEPAALLYALSLRAFPGQEATQLLPVVTAVEAQEETAGALPGLLVRTSSPVKPRHSNPEPGLARLELGDVIWDGGERTLRCGEATVTVKGGSRPGDPLVLDCWYPQNWEGRLSTASLLNDVKLVQEPAFPVFERAPAVSLTQLKKRRLAQGEGLVLELDRPVQYFWNYDPSSRYFTLEIPHATVAANLAAETLLTDQRLVTVASQPYPVLRLQGFVPQGKTYQFQEIEDEPEALALTLAPEGTVQALENTGTDKTAGYHVARGTIVIDPGHGGSDPGCINRDLGLMEKDVTLQISQQLAGVLREQGWTVVLTREDDRDVTYAGSPDKEELMARSEVANRLGADIFLSIHCNASVSKHHAGSSIHWWKAEDYELAQSLEHVLGTAVGFGQKGLIRNRFVVLRYAEMPSVLVETAFLTNNYEGSRLGDPRFQRLIAEQLAGGLASYIQGRYANAGLMHTQP